MKISIELDKDQWDALFNAVMEMPFRMVNPIAPILAEISNQAKAVIEKESAEKP